MESNSELTDLGLENLCTLTRQSHVAQVYCYTFRLTEMTPNTNWCNYDAKEKKKRGGGGEGRVVGGRFKWLYWVGQVLHINFPHEQRLIH